jgi:hypothetical protein
VAVGFAGWKEKNNDANTVYMDTMGKLDSKS